MDVIYSEITKTLKTSNVKASGSHYASRLDGTCEDVFKTLRMAFEAVRVHVSHTVIHATISKGSPSAPGNSIKL
jgi:hypothetical protein